MNELAAFILPPAVAFAGDRMNRWLLGRSYETLLGAGARFALGLAVGMLVFSQTLLLAVLAGFNLAGALAWLAFLWGAAELVLWLPQQFPGWKRFAFRPGHCWLLLLVPVLYFWYVIAQLSVLEDTIEFDGAAIWVFKAKILYLLQGSEFIHCLRQSNLGYAHCDYPLLLPAVYTLGYGWMGRVDEFVNKVWPFWMFFSLGLAILSFGNVLKQPKALAPALVLFLCFLPATFDYIRVEGATIPMVFFTGLATLLVVRGLTQNQPTILAAAVPVLAGCANTKFEGVLFAALWIGLLLPVCWRRGWLKTPALRTVLFFAVVAMVPFVLFRLTKPTPHVESGWVHFFLQSPAAALHRFPDIWLINIVDRLFGLGFAQWGISNQGQLVHTGYWSGFISFINHGLSVLPLLSLLLVAVGLFQARNRSIILLLGLVLLALITVLSFVIACMPWMQTDLAMAIRFGANDVGRYSYPFFVACFLGLVCLWFPDVSPSAPAAGPDSPNANPSPAKS